MGLAGRFRALLVLACCISLLAVSCGEATEEAPAAMASPEPINLIPTPLKISKQAGSFEITASTTIRCVSWAEQTANYLQSELQRAMGFELKVVVDDGFDNTQSLAPNSITIVTRDLGGKANEGYSLSVTPQTILIEGGAKLGGDFFAVQTVLQLLPPEIYSSEAVADKRWLVPAVLIKDEPVYPWRGLLLDCSRHFMDKAFVKRYIDLLARYKMNTLHWHLTEDQGWRIQIDKYPKLTEIGAWRTEADGSRYGGFYTKNDIREIVAYAQERHINIVPEIELPGHSQAALAAYPQFSCTGGPFEVETEWGVFKEIYCAGNDSTLVFLKDVLSEVMELFPGQYIHIGGDEVPKYRWENCGKCQSRIAAEGLHDTHELQSWFISEIGAFLEANGKTMIGWDEIREGGIPDGAIVQSWRGFEGAFEAVKAGHRTIVSPTSHAYFDYDLKAIDLEQVYSFDPTPEGIIGHEREFVLGGECNLWSERAPQEKVDSKVFPRMLAMAEVLWRSPENRNYPAFLDKVYAHYPRLDQMGVQYGFETVPVEFETSTEGETVNVLISSGIRDAEIGCLPNGPKPERGETTPEGIKLSFSEKDHQRWIKAWPKRNGQSIGDTSEISVFPHAALNKVKKLGTNYSEWYTGGGEQALADGVKGSDDFRDGHWQGYWGTDVQAVFDMGGEFPISHINMSFLQYINSWIWLPEEVVVEVSNNEKSWETISVLTTDFETPYEEGWRTQRGLFTNNFYLDYQGFAELPVGRYVRITAKNIGKCPDWHEAAGSDAWIFIDEISIY